MKFFKSIVFCALVSLSGSLFAGDIAVKNGQTIAFLGDSITAQGAKSMGYCQLLLSALKDQGIEVKGVFAGKSGHKSNQMLARLESDVLSKKPDWMTLSCGVNDVWHGKRGVALEPYKKNISDLVSKAQAAGIKVIILTATMIKEDQSNDLNQKLLPYNEFLRKFAKENNCLLADLNADMQAALSKLPKSMRTGKALAYDGVHMNGFGNIMMARGVAKAIGLTDAQLDASEKKWYDMPNTQQLRISSPKFSLKEIALLRSIAAEDGKDLSVYFTDLLNKHKDEMLKKATK